jgi:glycosyltransferase involved in cell wall biosynthesis
MRFHVIGLPPTRVCQTPTHPCDTLTFAIRGIIRILHGILGHRVVFYGSDDSDIDCTERVVINTAADRVRWYGADLDNTGMLAPPMLASEPAYREFNHKTVGALTARLEPHDFILIQGGLAQQPIADAYPAHQSVEYLIGYDGSFAPFRVFQTYMHMAYTYGTQGLSLGRDFDAAGFGFYYDPEEFPRAEKKGNYYAFIGRPFANKQPQVASQVCKHLGAKLIVAGQGARQDGPDCVVCRDGTRLESPGIEYVGVVGGLERAKLMGEALALFAPTNYREPFASVTQEAAMCGTPSITSDHGCFPETIIDGLNGYRCRNFAEYVEAARRVPELDSKVISDRAISLYSEAVLAKKYQAYFERLATLWGKGWYAMPTES